MEFVGNYESVQKENLEACMNTLGIPDHFKKLSPDLVLQLEISQDRGTYTVKEKVCMTLNESKFQLGKDFETVSWMQTPIKGVIDVKDGKMVGTIKEGQVTSVSTMQKNGDQLVKTRDFNGTKCVLTYKKL